MPHRIHRSHKEPKREGLSWNERWTGTDSGLITCWEVGRELREWDSDLASGAEKGELPVLAWKGGVEKKTQKGEKFGTLFYFAQWQGLRGEDLDIDPSQERELICTKTGTRVIYTGDLTKYGSV